MMNGPAKAGLTISVLTFFVGVWVFFAPFIVGYQKVGQEWTWATKNDMWTGGALIAVSVVTLVLVLSFALRDAVYAAEQRRLREEREAIEQGSPN